MRFLLLGPLAVSEDDGPVALGGPKQRLVLAHLLLRAGTTVPLDRLIDWVWGEEPPETARATLQTYVSRLRSVLGSERIDGEAPGYRFNAVPEEIDALRFESLLGEARDDGLDPRASLDVLDEALGLWHGPALADLALEPSLFGEISRLEELRLVATEERIAARLDLGHHAEVVAELEAATDANPMRERLWGQLILALYRSGRQADALAAFERARRLLADELGIDPSRELQDIHERVLRQDDSLQLPGEPLRGYRVLEKIGEGAFGSVYRAIQPHVEREVAVKSIHAELANQPDFVRRFEREAQLVARLEHPHIVPLYDYWREPDAAYLVMRYLRGGSLEDRIDERPLELEAAAAILDQVGAALSAAHQLGVVHRDVKPGNVLMDDSGNAYLSDFGIALETGAPEQTAGTMIRGTPAYLSPEQIRLEQATPRSDIYALGVVLYEMLTGEHPFPGTSLNVLLDQHLHHPIPSVRAIRPEMPPTIDAAIARATAKDAQSRFADVMELCTAFREAIGGRAPMIAVGEELRNPYKGLRAFLEADTADFFGREVVTRRLIERIAEPGSPKFLCVVGPSGSGKSSVVRAGVVPAIRRGAIPGSERWYVVDLVPGAHPVRELERALLGVSVDPPPSLIDELERDELGLTRAVERVLPDPDAELLIVLDQLEEIFTITTDQIERALLLDCIRAATSDPGSRIRVVATLRADFFDQPLSVRGFGELLASRNEAITPMSPEELERAIVGPAERVGLDVEPGLVAAMVADVIDRPGALPLLQYALTELADREDVRALTLSAYRRIGGVSGALARRAEHLFDASDDAGRTACRQLFLRLVTLGEGTEDTRHRVRRSDLPELRGGAMDGVIDAFGRHRLLSFDRDPITREPTIEIAHEALLRSWSRLRGWIDEARDDLRIQRQVAAAATDWEASTRDPSFLLRGARLEQLRGWAEGTTVGLAREDRAFLEASVERHDEELAAERAAQEREQLALERERALERRSVLRLRGLVALGVAAALVATTLTVAAVSQRNRAQREGRIATSRELASASVANLEVDPQRSLLLALAGVTASGDDGVLPEVEEALRRAVVEDREVLTLQDLTSTMFAVSPDGDFMLTPYRAGAGDREDDLVLRDATTGVPLRRIEGVPGGFYDTRWSPDGSRVIASTTDSTLVAWDTQTWSREWMVNLGRELSEANGIEISPDGRLLAVVGGDGILSLVDTDTGREVRRMRVPKGAFLNVAFSPDGSRVGAAANFGGPTPIWDVKTGRLLLELDTADSFGIAFSPDGGVITTSGSDGAVQMWNARTGDELAPLEGQQGEVWGVAYSPDGRLLASAGDDGVRVWDTVSQKQLLDLHGHDGTVFGLRFEPDGRHLITSGADHTVRVWDVSAAGSHEMLTIGDWWWGLDDAEFSPDGTRLGTIGSPGFLQWEAHAASPVSAAVPLGWGTISYGPEGSRYVTAGQPVVGEAVAGGTSHALHNRSIWSAAYSPDGTTVAGGLAGDEDGTGLVFVWDADTGDHVLTFGKVGTKIDHIRGVAYSPDGKLLAGLAASGGVHLWDLVSGQEVKGWDTGTDNGDGIAFSPDGSLLATSGADGADVWKSASGELVVQLRGHAGDVPDVAFSPDGTMVATAGEDGTARVWDVSTGRQLHVLFGHQEGLTGVSFSPDGTSVATSSGDGTLREYFLDLGDLIREASSRLTRSLSSQECRLYLHVSPCPTWVARPDPVEASPAPNVDLEGSFRISIVPSQLERPITRGQAKRTLGQYTLSMFDGSWWLHQEQPNGWWFDSSGSYTTDGETVTLTDLADPECFGASWSARWELNGTSLVFSDTTPSPTCTGQRVPTWTGVQTWSQKGEAWAQTVFEAPGWSRIG